MKKQSLNEIMNEMAGRMDVTEPSLSPSPSTFPSSSSTDLLSELDAFMKVDPLLAGLNKDYLEAKSQRKELLSLYGADDAMTEVALDMEDSAWCAMQTRYLEVRLDRELMAQVQRLMRDVEEQVALEVMRDKAYQAQQFSYSLQGLEKVREQNKTPSILEWMILLLLFKMKPFAALPNYSRSYGMAA